MRAVPALKNAFTLFVAASFCAGQAFANPPEGKGNPHKKHQENEQVTVSLSIGQAREIAVSNGLTGYRPLPPGIRKRLARGKPLPPGIAKKMVPAPMLQQLPQYPDRQWVVVGSDLVLMAVATAVVVDVLAGVFK
jgi:Ni/Co efflux regulator RcnB